MKIVSKLILRKKPNFLIFSFLINAPLFLIIALCYVNYITDKRLSTVTYSARNIGKIIQNLDSNKVHGHHNLSVPMLKICSDSICVLLGMFFKQALLTGVFPFEWKKGNIAPIHKKGDKQNIKNYRPVCLLPIWGKIFERLIFNEMFIYFSTNKLISKNQSGFQPGDSCINQLLTITHKIFTSMDNGLEVRSFFLEISKAFDKVWNGVGYFQVETQRHFW